jgi:hypothetical protein
LGLKHYGALWVCNAHMLQGLHELVVKQWPRILGSDAFMDSAVSLRLLVVPSCPAAGSESPPPLNGGQGIPRTKDGSIAVYEDGIMVERSSTFALDERLEASEAADWETRAANVFAAQLAASAACAVPGTWCNALQLVSAADVVVRELGGAFAPYSAMREVPRPRQIISVVEHEFWNVRTHRALVHATHRQTLPLARDVVRTILLIASRCGERTNSQQCSVPPDQPQVLPLAASSRSQAWDHTAYADWLAAMWSWVSEDRGAILVDGCGGSSGGWDDGGCGGLPGERNDDAEVQRTSNQTNIQTNIQTISQPGKQKRIPSTLVGHVQLDNENAAETGTGDPVTLRKLPLLPTDLWVYIVEFVRRNELGTRC